IPIAPALSQQRSNGLALDSALRRAVASNPKLAAADRDIGIAIGKHRQSAAIPNPELIFELDDAFGTGDFRGLKSSQAIIGLGQLIELGGKREARVALGSAEVQSARWQREAV